MKQLLLIGGFLVSASVHAQACQGGLYLNPQVIRGEGASQTESALKELIEFIRPTGLSVSPVLNIKEAQDVLSAVKRPDPPCWVYGNPVVGLASGYRPIAVKTPDALLLKALDLGKNYEFATPSEAAVAAMKRSLAP